LYNTSSTRENLTVNTEATSTVEPQPTGEKATGTRRGTLAAFLAGSALGLAAMSGAPQAEAAKGKKGKKGKKNKGGKDGETEGNGLPSVRYVYKSTTFTDSGVGTASATCPSGYLPIGAGIWSSITEPVILSSLPLLNSNSWEFELDGVQPQREATVIAICLAASDDTTVEDTEHRTTHRKRGERGRKKSK
jgi:hypothetical protein